MGPTRARSGPSLPRACRPEQAGYKGHSASTFADSADCKDQSYHDRGRASDNKPNRTIGRIAGEGARNVRAEGVRLVKAENQQNDSERENCQTDDIIHAATCVERGYSM